MPLNYSKELYENRVFSTYPTTPGASNTGALITSFVAGAPIFLLSAGNKDLNMISLEVALTTLPANSTAINHAIAVDTTQRFDASLIGNQLMVAANQNLSTAATNCLTNPTMTTGATGGAPWLTTGDFTLAADVGGYSHATGAGTLFQRYADMGTTKTSVLQDDQSCVVTYEVAATAGAGLLTATMGGSIFADTQNMICLSSGAIAAATYQVRARVGRNPQPDSTFTISMTSNAAALSTITSINITRDSGAASQALAYSGNLAATTASSSVTYVESGMTKLAAAALYDRLFFDFGRGMMNKSAANPFIIPVSPVIVPANGSLLLYIWIPGGDTTSPTWHCTARWVE